MAVRVYEMNEDILASVKALVAYNEDGEYSDYLCCVESGDIEEGSENHIYTHIVRVQEWLNGL